MHVSMADSPISCSRDSERKALTSDCSAMPLRDDTIDDDNVPLVCETTDDTELPLPCTNSSVQHPVPHNNNNNNTRDNVYGAVIMT